jgi:hypothetical protein
MSKDFDKKFIEFPLHCLLYCADDKERLKEIILFCIVDSAMKSKIYEESDINYAKPEDFDIDNEIHRKITSAAAEYNYGIESIGKAINVWLEIKPILLDYEDKYGMDAYCSMGMQLTNDVLNERFGFREYKVLAAIQSVLGKKKIYLRITYEHISYRVLGYKKKKIALAEGKMQGALSARQIKTSVTKLIHKKLLTTATYMNREKYYSTKIKSADKLRELIKNKKIRNYAIRHGTEDYRWSIQTKEELSMMRSRMSYEL